MADLNLDLSAIASGEPRRAAPIANAFTQIQALLNGNLDNGNLASDAGIEIAKTELAAFTPWTTWAPAVTAQAGTYTAAPTTNQRSRWRYMVLAKVIVLNCYERYNLTGAAAGYIDIPLPSGITIPNPTGTGDKMRLGYGNGLYYDGASRNGTLRIFEGTESGDSFTSIRIARLGNADANPTWTVNNGSEFGFMFVHEID